KRYGTSFGVGWRFPVENLGRLQAVSVEATGVNLYPSFHRGGANAPIVSSLRVQAAYRLVGDLAVMGGLGMNVAVGYSDRDADVGLGVLETTWKSGQTTVRLYPGFVLGVQ